jgi:hypothetical protein
MQTLVEIEEIKNILKNLYTMKDLGELQKILGIKVDRDRKQGIMTMS